MDEGEESGHRRHKRLDRSVSKRGVLHEEAVLDRQAQISVTPSDEAQDCGVRPPLGFHCKRLGSCISMICKQLGQPNCRA